MKAIVYHNYGATDVLKLEEVEKPAPKENEVLVKIHAAAVTPGDVILMKGDPFVTRLFSGLLEPKHKILGKEMAGRVEAVGGNVTQFQPGDEVFGDLSVCGLGAFAEYVSVPENAIALKPANLTFEAAAAVPESAVVALQGLRDKGNIQAGQKVLINGASGGVGSFAVQIAKSYGTEVTAVCSTRNMDLARSLGADCVIDYTKEDLAQKGAALYNSYVDLYERFSKNSAVNDRLRDKLKFEIENEIERSKRKSQFFEEKDTGKSEAFESERRFLQKIQNILSGNFED